MQLSFRPTKNPESSEGGFFIYVHDTCSCSPNHSLWEVYKYISQNNFILKYIFVYFSKRIFGARVVFFFKYICARVLRDSRTNDTGLAASAYPAARRYETRWLLFTCMHACSPPRNCSVVLYAGMHACMLSMNRSGCDVHVQDNMLHAQRTDRYACESRIWLSCTYPGLIVMHVNHVYLRSCMHSRPPSVHSDLNTGYQV